MIPARSEATTMTNMTTRRVTSVDRMKAVLTGVLAVAIVTSAPLAAQSGRAETPVTVEAAPVPADYVIGPEDVLTINFRYEPDISGDVTVRPDGKISLQIVKDIDAAGLTVEQLRVKLNEAAAPYIKGDPAISVQAKLIKSRKVSIMGEVGGRQGEYPLLGPTNVTQLLAQAGGLGPYANQKRILIIRTVNGKQTSRIFNYDDFKKGKNLEQNILLQPGDQIIVPE